MKKVLAVVLSLVLVLSLTACGSKASLEGSWKITSLTQNGEDTMSYNGINIVEKLAARGFYFGLTAKSDKTAILRIGEEDQNVTWDDKTIGVGNDTAEYTISGDTLTITGKNGDADMKMVLKKMTDEEAKNFAAQSAEDLQKAQMEIALELIGQGVSEDE
jgi:hypothetical protein